MSDKKYDSVLVGYAEEPVYYEMVVWSFKLKEMIDSTPPLETTGRAAQHHLLMSRTASLHPRVRSNSRLQKRREETQPQKEDDLPSDKAISSA